ncbi:hypothetical protein BH23ACT9_BH23ACT9_04480 [soil metagenome]
MSLDNSPVQLEIRRLARMLTLEPDALSGLANLPVEDLRTLRGQVASKLFDEGADSWDRAVAVSGIVPSGLAAKLSQGALGPVLAARVTSLVDTDRAVDIASKLPAGFMADTAVNIDPRSVTGLVVQLPPTTIAEVGAVLAERGEWLVMADFVAAVTLPALRTTIDSLDEEAILRAGVLLEDPERVTQVVAMLSASRIIELRRVAVDEGLEDHLAHISGVVDDDQRARLSG